MQIIKLGTIKVRGRWCEVYRSPIKRTGMATVVFCYIRPLRGSRRIQEPWPDKEQATDLVERVLNRERTGYESTHNDDTWKLFLGILDGSDGSPTREEIDQFCAELVKTLE